MRALADQSSRFAQERISELDLDQLAETYGVDPDRARDVAGAAGQWISDHLAGGEPLFGQSQSADPAADPRGAPLNPSDYVVPAGEAAPRTDDPGPSPLDLPTASQGLALSALDSTRWTVRPGSSQLLGTGVGPAPSADSPDLVSELRARDWITADGTLTLVGRHALRRWCRTAPDPPGPLASDAPAA